MASKLKEKFLKIYFLVGEYTWTCRNIPTCFMITKEAASGFRFCYAPIYGLDGFGT